MKICYNCFNEIPESAKTCPRCGSSAELWNVDKYPHALPCGSVLNGRFIVGRVLGQGGFGITYVGQDFKTKKLVAIKEYFPDTMATRDASHSVMPFNTDRSEGFEYGRKQFLDEAKTLSAFIGSPNIVRVSSFFEENGTAYFVMEHVRGTNLRQYIAGRGGRIPWEEAWDLLMPVLDALSEVHFRNIIHRDIKPDNIIITKSGNAKLIDFGAARYSHNEKSKSLTAVLTPGYAPVEQYFSRGKQGPWTDVYALAATIYFCITGKAPAESVERSVDDALEKPSELGISIPAYAETALMKALAVKDQDRFKSTYDFRNAVLEGKRLEEEKTGGTDIGDSGTPAPAGERPGQEESGNAVSGRGQQPRGNNDADGKQQSLGNSDADGKQQSLGNSDANGGQQPLRNGSAGGVQETGTDRGAEGGAKSQGTPKPVTQEKGSAGRPNKILLVAAIIAIIAVAAFVWPKGGSHSETGTETKIGTGGSGQQTRIINEDKEQEEPSSSGDNDKKEESFDNTEPTLDETTESISEEDTETGKIARTSDDSMALSDTWEEIIGAVYDGTYKDRYQIGNTKELDMGTEGVITMKLVAMDEDDLADGSGKAPMTWVADEVLQSAHNMNSEKTNKGSWEASEMRAWLRETVLPLMPEEVRSNIREVTKYSYSYEEEKGVASRDTIWIPSVREVFLSDQSDWVNEYKEQEGVSYTSVFTDNKSRERSRDGESGASWWWLRSAGYDTSYYSNSVTSDGDSDCTIAAYEGGVVIGFCF